MNLKTSAHCLLAAILLMTGCGTTGPKPPPPPPPPPKTTTLSCKLPAITPLPETKQAQEKGGIEISVAPASYKAALVKSIKQRQTEPTWGEAFQISTTIPQDQRGNYMFVEETTELSLKPTPNRLQFLIKLNNKLPRVFRGAGTVVQFNVGGKLLAVDQSGYAEMVQAIVPPRTEQQLTINGPTLDLIPDNATVGLFLYDVVTAIDAAGNVTEKQNYEWYFNYSIKTEDQTIDVVPPQRKLIPIQQFRPLTSMP